MPDKTKEIYIEDYFPKLKTKKTNLCQNDFFIKIGETATRVTIFSSQPIYSNEKKTNFEIMDEEFSNMMGYRKFNVEKKIILHDIKDNQEFSLKLNSLLEKLSF